MTQFCPHCGFQLEPDAIFCPNCGQRVVEEANQDDFGSVNTVKLPHGMQNMAANDAAPMPTPVQSPSWGPGNSNSGNGSTPQGNSYPKANARLFAAIGGAVAAGAVAAALVFNFVVLPKQQASIQGAQDAQQQTSDQDAPGGANQVQGGSDGTADQAFSNAQAQAGAQEEERAKADSKIAAADAQATMEAQADSDFHSSLVSYYQQLSDYDSRIKDAASTFNNNFLTASLGSRESYASSASSLMSDLESTRDAL